MSRITSEEWDKLKNDIENLLDTKNNKINELDKKLKIAIEALRFYETYDVGTDRGKWARRALQEIFDNA